MGRTTERALIACTLALCALQAHAFKMGFQGQLDELRAQASGSLNAKLDDEPHRLQFGDPIHEDMTQASIEMAAANADRMQCTTSREKVEAFVRQAAQPRLSHGMCCHKGAVSKACSVIGMFGGNQAFADVLTPMQSGVRWNDDPCHMTHEAVSRVSWALWMTGNNYMEYNNSNYASHFHEHQFLHAMAPSARNDPKPLAARQTRKRILMWAEFALRVADGSIPPNTKLKDVRALLSTQMQQDFELAFGGYGPRTVALLFTGLDDGDPQLVRQTALGALFHTVQDSYSSSHVERANDPFKDGTPGVLNKGDIVRFYTYRGQDGGKHGKADRRPHDLAAAQIDDLHPMSIGAQLLACTAASQNAPSQWEEGMKIVQRNFTLRDADINRASTPGKDYAK